MPFSYADLNLRGVNVASPGGNRLKPGRYICKIKEPQYKDTKNGSGGGFSCVFVNVDTAGGEISNFINLFNRSEEAQRIGREQFKALAVHSGHPNPDSPGNAKSFLGREVGVVVVDEEYTDRKTGEKRQGSAVAGFIAPTEVDPDYSRDEGASGDEMDDDIPF